MNNWEYFAAGKKQAIKLDDSISVQIVEALGAKMPVPFFKKSKKIPRKQTKHVMDALSRLGRKMKFKSMSHGISGKLNKDFFKKSEWLYDLHWYEEKKRKKYQMTSLPLVVECEWEWIREAERNKLKKAKSKKKPDCFGAIKWDFQKLLVANADLRVMIFKPRINDGDDGKKLNDKLDEYFTETITGYRNLPLGSKFLFVAFDEDGFWYSEKSKREK